MTSQTWIGSLTYTLIPFQFTVMSLKKFGSRKNVLLIAFSPFPVSFFRSQGSFRSQSSLLSACSTLFSRVPISLLQHGTHVQFHKYSRSVLLEVTGCWWEILLHFISASLVYFFLLSLIYSINTFTHFVRGAKELILFDSGACMYSISTAVPYPHPRTWPSTLFLPTLLI